MADPKKGLAIAIGIPKPSNGDDGPPPMGPPDGSPLKSMGKDRSQQFCDNCEYFCTDLVCMMYPEWQQHDAKDWCGQWKEGQPRDLKGDAASAGASPQGPPAPGGPPAGPPQMPPGGPPNAPR